MKIRYGSYDDSEGRRKKYVYRRKIYVPGPTTVMTTLSILAFQFPPENIHDGVVTVEEIPGVILMTLGGVLATVAVVFMCFTPSSYTRRSIIREVFVGKKPLPDGFDHRLIDHSDYQKALEEHMRGKNIGSLYPLTQSILRDGEVPGEERSLVVENILQHRNLMKQSVEEVKGVGGII